MTTYPEAASRLSSTEAQAALNALKKLQYGDNLTRRFAANVAVDFRVPESVWNDIFVRVASLGRVADDDVGAAVVADTFRAVFRAHLKQVPDVTSIESRQPVGPTITDLKAEAFGRLTSMKQLTSLWQWAAPAKGTPRASATLSYDASQRLIESIATPTGLAMQRRRGALPDLPLGRFIMWSTFDGGAKGPDPFQPRSAKVSDLMAHLGLDSILLFDRHPRDLNEPSLPPCFYVLMTFQMPATISIHVPTVVEAYAGPGRMNYYFEVWRGDVSASLNQFPRTMAGPSEVHTGYPEVVHSVIFGDQLTDCLQIERAT